MTELGTLLRSFFEYAVQVGGLPFALMSVFAAVMFWENRRLKKRIDLLSDGLIEDGRDATDKLLEMAASKLMSEATTASALGELAKSLEKPTRRAH